MQIIDRHLRKAIMSQFILVLSVLMSLFIFITFIDELGSINRGSYGLLKIAQFVVLSVPKICGVVSNQALKSIRFQEELLKN